MSENQGNPERNNYVYYMFLTLCVYEVRRLRMLGRDHKNYSKQLALDTLAADSTKE